MNLIASILIFTLFIIEVYSNCGCLKCNTNLHVISPPGSAIKLIYKNQPCSCPYAIPYSIQVPQDDLIRDNGRGRSYVYQVYPEKIKYISGSDPCDGNLRQYGFQVQIPIEEDPRKSSYLHGLTAKTDRIIIGEPPRPPGCSGAVIEPYNFGRGGDNDDDGDSDDFFYSPRSRRGCGCSRYKIIPPKIIPYEASTPTKQNLPSEHFWVLRQPRIYRQVFLTPPRPKRYLCNTNSNGGQRTVVKKFSSGPEPTSTLHVVPRHLLDQSRKNHKDITIFYKKFMAQNTSEPVHSGKFFKITRNTLFSERKPSPYLTLTSTQFTASSNPLLSSARPKRSINWRLLALKPENPSRYQRKRQHNIPGNVIWSQPTPKRQTSRNSKIHDKQKLKRAKNNAILKLKKANRVINNWFSKDVLKQPLTPPEIQIPNFAGHSGNYHPWCGFRDGPKPRKRLLTRYKRAIRLTNEKMFPFFGFEDEEKKEIAQRRIRKLPRSKKLEEEKKAQEVKQEQIKNPEDPFLSALNFEHILHPTPLIHLLNAPIRYLNHVHKLRSHVSPVLGTIPKVIQVSKRYLLGLLKTYGKTAFQIGGHFIKGFAKLKKGHMLAKLRRKRSVHGFEGQIKERSVEGKEDEKTEASKNNIVYSSETLLQEDTRFRPHMIEETQKNFKNHSHQEITTNIFHNVENINQKPLKNQNPAPKITDSSKTIDQLELKNNQGLSEQNLGNPEVETNTGTHQEHKKPEETKFGHSTIKEAEETLEKQHLEEESIKSLESNKDSHHGTLENKEPSSKVAGHPKVIEKTQIEPEDSNQHRPEKENKVPQAEIQEELRKTPEKFEDSVHSILSKMLQAKEINDSKQSIFATIISKFLEELRPFFNSDKSNEKRTKRAVSGKDQEEADQVLEEFIKYLVEHGLPQEHSSRRKRSVTMNFGEDEEILEEVLRYLEKVGSQGFNKPLENEREAEYFDDEKKSHEAAEMLTLLLDSEDSKKFVGNNETDTEEERKRRKRETFSKPHQDEKIAIKQKMDIKESLSKTAEVKNLKLQPSIKEAILNKKHKTTFNIHLQTIKEKLVEILSNIENIQKYNPLNDQQLYLNLLKLEKLKNNLVDDLKTFREKETLQNVEFLKEKIFKETMRKLVCQETISKPKLIKLLIRLQKFTCLIKTKDARLLVNFHLIPAKNANEIKSHLEQNQEEELQKEIDAFDELKKIVDIGSEEELEKEARILWEIKNVEKLQRHSIFELSEKVSKGLTLRRELKILFDLQKQLEDCAERQKSVFGSKGYGI